MVRGGDGRLWVATETGTLWMDPAHVVRNALAPGVAIKSITADQRAWRDPATLELPAGTAKIEIDFSVLSLADPSRVQARYRLEGFDHEWVDAGARRQAFYTNLPPGKYRFRVTGANNDGVWNRAGATLAFTIPPTFFQSGWFILLCAVLLLAVLGAIYRLRVRQIARRIHARLDERAGERERIARELHDTLLQGIQGLMLRFQAVADRLTHDDRSREQLEAALVAADEVVVDARNRVRDLRGVEGTNDLCLIVEHLVAQAPFDPPIPVRIVVEGKPRLLHPFVAEEIKRIVREALFNTALHARASSAEVAIGFEPRHLAIRLRDDGVGIPGDVVAHGHKDGHFGMIGMRERAERIGGKLMVSSRPGAGSEITLTLPAKLAFARGKPRRRRWLRLPMRRKPFDE
jgi:signal transduction histidine kinase